MIPHLVPDCIVIEGPLGLTLLSGGGVEGAAVVVVVVVGGDAEVMEIVRETLNGIHRRFVTLVTLIGKRVLGTKRRFLHPDSPTDDDDSTLMLTTDTGSLP